MATFDALFTPLLMKKALFILLIILWTGAGNKAFSQNAPQSASPIGNSSPFGGGGINPNDITPPPDPIDTPIDAGLIFLLIIGLAYGVTKMNLVPKSAQDSLSRL